MKILKAVAFVGISAGQTLQPEKDVGSEDAPTCKEIKIRQMVGQNGSSN